MDNNNQDNITITLSMEECIAIFQALMTRGKYLDTQPQTIEWATEIAAGHSFLEKIGPLVRQKADQEVQQIKARWN